MNISSLESVIFKELVGIVAINLRNLNKQFITQQLWGKKWIFNYFGLYLLLKAIGSTFLA